MRLNSIFIRAILITAGLMAIPCANSYAQSVTEGKAESVVFRGSDKKLDIKVVRDSDGVGMKLVVNGSVAASTGDGSMRRAYYPFLMASRVEKTLLVGIGSGAPVFAALNASSASVSVVVESRDLIKAAEQMPGDNFGVLKDRRVTYTVEAPSTWIAKAKGPYDVIMAGHANRATLADRALLTQKSFQSYRGLLKETGVFAQWLNLSSLDTEDLKKIIATFSSVFPHVYIWGGDMNPVNSWIMLAGMNQPMVLNPEILSARLKTLDPNRDITEADNVYSFLSFYVCDGDEIKPLLESAPVISKPGDIPFKGGFTEEESMSRSADNFLLLGIYRNPIISKLVASEPVKEKMSDYFKARSFILNGRKVGIAGSAQEEIGLYDKAMTLAPEDPHLALSYLAIGLAYYRSGILDRAADLLEKAKKITPDRPQIRFYLGKTYEKMGWSAKANMEFNALRELTPDYMERVNIPTGRAPSAPVN
ncbi:MAG: tetratricopeptide repeat protein [Nitrospinae bacterium]|nr:tetratricopeptide repeat protein [Nitrospinota bacterium]